MNHFCQCVFFFKEHKNYRSCWKCFTVQPNENIKQQKHRKRIKSNQDRNIKPVVGSKKGLEGSTALEQQLSSSVVLFGSWNTSEELVGWPECSDWTGDVQEITRLDQNLSDFTNKQQNPQINTETHRKSEERSPDRVLCSGF